SDLGPRMACTALKEFASARLNIHFVSNVDGTDINDVLSNLNPETTLIIISSKTFTTMETLLNADKALAWLEKNLEIQNIRSSNHVIGVTANSKNAKLFGIDETRVVEFDDWVGGRYSIWSSIGLSLAISIGFDNFQIMLSGAREIDNHFRESPFDQNIPVIMAVLGIWYNNFLGAQSHAIIPYCERLTLFPSYLQQLDMESNGKSVDQNGEQLKYQTAPIIWGQTGTNGQHAFFQLLHQGTKFIPIDFIAPITQNQSDDKSQKILLNNMLAQSMSLMVGKKAKEGENHKSYPGNKPSSTLLINSLSPKTLGALIAIYEHKVFVQGTIWGINSFDQWGVELGKELSIALNKGNISNIDPSTDQLKDIISKFSSY
ncbi:MAG: glucose-6-phosphate isomerase, partial [SAR92 clade bacterium]